jgi:hypothetical protein
MCGLDVGAVRHVHSDGLVGGTDGRSKKALVPVSAMVGVFGGGSKGSRAGG